MSFGISRDVSPLYELKHKDHCVLFRVTDHDFMRVLCSRLNPSKRPPKKTEKFLCCLEILVLLLNYKEGEHSGKREQLIQVRTLDRD